MEKLFLVIQNIDHLAGKYFVRAVVIAESSKQAIDRTTDYMSEYDDVIFDGSRVTAVEIGTLTTRPQPKTEWGLNQSKETELLTLEIGEDFDP